MLFFGLALIDGVLWSEFGRLSAADLDFVSRQAFSPLACRDIRNPGGATALPGFVLRQRARNGSVFTSVNPFSFPGAKQTPARSARPAGAIG